MEALLGLPRRKVPDDALTRRITLKCHPISSLKKAKMHTAQPGILCTKHPIFASTVDQGPVLRLPNFL